MNVNSPSEKGTWTNVPPQREEAKLKKMFLNMLESRTQGWPGDLVVQVCPGPVGAEEGCLIAVSLYHRL